MTYYKKESMSLSAMLLNKGTEHLAIIWSEQERCPCPMRVLFVIPRLLHVHNQSLQS